MHTIPSSRRDACRLESTPLPTGGGNPATPLSGDCFEFLRQEFRASRSGIIPPGMAYHAPFEIDIVSALSEQLIAAFEDLDVGPLEVVAIGDVKREQGVYQLFHKGTLVYVGRADNLNSRVSQHLEKISGRENISQSDMGFKALYVHKNWTTLAPEDTLIKHFKAHGAGLCEWNGNGFGPHDPGRERETTNKHPDGFDAKYPIRHDWLCTWIQPGQWNVLKLLVAMKDGLPFLLRYQTSDDPKAKVDYRKGHPDQRVAEVEVSLPEMPADKLLALIAGSMPDWQATRFPSHMILYKESEDYTYGVKLLP